MSKGGIYYMKEAYTMIFKQCFRSYLLQTRTQLGLTQAQMSERLNISERVYANLEEGHSCCSTITFVLFLISCADNYDSFIENLRNSFNEIYTNLHLETYP